VLAPGTFRDQHAALRVEQRGGDDSKTRLDEVCPRFLANGE